MGNGLEELELKPVVEPVPERLTVDAMLQKYCGEFGPWQLKNFFLSNLSCTLEAFHTMVMIFADRDMAWRCLDHSGCNAAEKDVCRLEPGSWEWVGGRGSSTVVEWGLVCGNKYKVGLAQAIFFVGCTLGAGIFGHLSDSSFGRKRSLILVCILNTIFGCLTALSPSYWIYVLLRLLTGVSTAGNALCAFVLSTEPIGPTRRCTAAMSTCYFFSGGIALLSGIAYIFQSWRKLYIVSSIPSLFYLILVVPFLSESPRWFLVRGKFDKAMKALTIIANTNKKHIPEGVVLSLDTKNSQTNNNSNNNKSIIDIMRSPTTRMRLIIGVGVNFMNAVVYYGLSLNVVNLKTNLYVNVLLNAVVEMPAFAVTAALLGKMGRRGVGIWTLWFSGVFCLMGSMIKSNSEGKWRVLKVACGLLGLSGMAGNYNLLGLYVAELFPTVVRNVALGCASQATQMGAILAPFVVVMGGRWPFLVFGVCGIVGGMLVFFLPETLNRPFYDTLAGLEDGENTNIASAPSNNVVRVSSSNV
ncbi:organic cation/carnitine transporter 4-like [Cucurbita moschata]|uniref:Organic cation/carnitine transporter 4-like n=1 Tax=Cucurbita moschata TaxID=3662 RepID=A0A6J1FEU3_CUCMO|nr:organic cation/carnitine transporter 4-like [Cucurbita moschata]